MSRPSFQFYTKDWRSNSKLRRCSPAARGVWADILCALHDSDEYGIARYPLKELASEVGASMSHVRELVDKGVLKGSDTELSEPLVYVPRSGRKEGPPVTLLAVQPGPIWYSSRQVKDEHVRIHRGESSRFGEDDGGPSAPTPKQAPKAAPLPSPKPPLGDGSSIASASATAALEAHADTPPELRARLETPKPEESEPYRYEPDEPDPPPVLPGVGTKAGAICKAMRATGLPGVNPGHSTFLKLVEQGATEAEFVGLAQEAAPKGKGFAWVLVALQSRRVEAAAVRLAPVPISTTASAEVDKTRAYLEADRRHREAVAAERMARNPLRGVA